MQAIDISIVIVNYNVKDFLYQCLLSIRSAVEGLNVETIVVDNNSQDNSVAILAPLFPEVIFKALPENIGFGKANNLGFSMAKGKYILILNPDTILQEDTLNTMMDYMEKSPEVGIAGCKVLNADGTFQLPCRRGFPTPWAAFCKLFGLQKIFPKSRIFAQYNQTFRDENETYYIDAIIGAFMFARKEVINQLEGFDRDFFMYGEDLDLCYRTYKLGYKVAYLHTTSIIHYKGESTKRSSINDIKHFYEAMEIFAKKHSTNSTTFLLFLKVGIKLRALLSIVSRKKEDIVFIFSDILMANLLMLISTYIRYDGFMQFPEYAYPTVFIVLSTTILISMVAVGEYFEKGKSIKRAFQGLLVSFFVLSSLTYYFKDYAFSRGILLMTIGFTIVGASLTRALYSLFTRIKGKMADRNIAIAGYSEDTNRIIQSLQNADSRNTNLVGVININSNSTEVIDNIPIIGNFEYIDKLIKQYKLNEIIVNSNQISNNNLLSIISKNDKSNVRFHLVKEYDDIITARIIDEITNSEPTIPHYNISRFRIKFIKRFADYLLSFLGLTLGLPITIALFVVGKKDIFKSIFSLIKGDKTLVGIYPTKNKYQNSVWGEGLIGLAHISSPKRLSDQAIEKLNDYYLKNCTLSMDIDIIIKSIIRNKLNQ